MAYPFLIQGNNIVVVIGNKSHTISKTHITYNKVLEAIKAEDWDSLPDIIEPKKVVLNYGAGNVSIQGETLFWKGKELNTGLSVRMINMLQEGFPIEPMVNFMENLYKNPSHRAVTELYDFLEKNALPITPDGHFLAYKKVRANYTDCHTGTMDNSVGKIVEMERHEVNDNKDITCSTGLHFCGMSYLSSFSGERTVIVKINPADVVSIPSDYNNAKGRACRYEVIGELNVAPESAFDSSVQTMSNSKDLKTGSSEFYRGYTDGFRAKDYTGNTTDYDEGYSKGSVDRENGYPERYRYVAKVQAGDWPHPKY